MSLNVRAFHCPPAAVFEVLADGWLYPVWVVGASRMRDVEDAWPEAGAVLQHSVGAWPVLLNDETVSLEWDPPHRMAMQAKGWPIGEARVVLDVKPRGNECVVRIQEQAQEGPGRWWMPRLVRELILYARNRETLQRLAFLVEGRWRNGERTVG